MASDDGRQFVLDGDGKPVYGVWPHPDEYSEPVVVERPATYKLAWSFA